MIIKRKATFFFVPTPKKGNCRTVFFVQNLLLFIHCTPCVRRQFRSALFRPRSGAFLPAVFVAAAPSDFSGTGRLFCRKVVLYPIKLRRNAAPVIYSAVSYRFYNVFYKKAFTNEFQKHII